MTNPDDPAEPCYHSTAPVGAHGLTKREYFAALNHAAILRAAAFNQEAENMLAKAGVKPGKIEAFIAHLAVSAADALVKELNL